MVRASSAGVLGVTVSHIFHSTGVRVALSLLIFTVAVFWLAVVFWLHRDARRRVDDLWLVWTATILGLVPVLGLLVYLLFRPPEALQEAHARDVEIQALEARLAAVSPTCLVCRTPVEASYLVCPVCTTQLRQPCASCSAPLERLWQACPYCAAPVMGPVPASPPALERAAS